MNEFIDVICFNSKDGDIYPLYIIWENGIKYQIDKILQKCPAASLKHGGSGMRYTCLIQNQMRYLFNDNNRWFIDKI